jgi:uncharacterized membrane protein YbaN (DUF454 family)
MLGRIKHSLLVVAGVLSLAAGIVGIFLPIMPTVPFVLLSAYCFGRSSKRLHNRLLATRYFGPIIRDFESGRGIPRRIKIRAIVVVWISMGISCWIVARPLLYPLLAAIGLGVSVYIYRLPDYEMDIDAIEQS